MAPCCASTSSPDRAGRFRWIQTTGSYWSLFLIAGCAYPLALAVMYALTPRMTPVEFRHPREVPSLC